MSRFITSCLTLLAVQAVLAAQDPPREANNKNQGTEEAVFRSDIAMGRIDAQVLDTDLRAIPNLSQDDFLLWHQGESIPIRKFSYQDMAVDVVLLLDVSGSMRPQVERVASASNRALHVLSNKDRVAIMTFTTHTRTHLKFSEQRDEIDSKLHQTVRDASFNGGTDINRALLDAAAYIEKDGRHEARHAIVIVTDDLARPIDRKRVEEALSEADAVVMALVTPEALWNGNGPSGYPGGGSPGGGYPGGGYPGGRHPGGGYPPVIIAPWPGGGGMGGPGYPRRGPNTGPWPGGAPNDMPQAGTSEVARESGGEGFPSSDAYSLETAFTRIRQQYTMYFYLPSGATEEDAAAVAVDLTNNTRIRHRDAELRYRQVYLSGNTRRTFARRVPARPPKPGTGLESTATAAASNEPSVAKRRPATSEKSGPRVQIPVRDTAPGTKTAPATKEAASPEPVSVSTPPGRRRAVSEPSGSRPGSLP